MKEYREVDVTCLRSELSKHPSFFDREDLVDSVVALVVDDFPEAITQDQIRSAIETVRTSVLAENQLPDDAPHARIWHNGFHAALDALDTVVSRPTSPPGRYRVCTKCEINHYENCGTCYGFGVYDSLHGGGLLPIIAIRAHDKRPLGPPLPCPECGSTIEGVPQGEPR